MRQGLASRTRPTQHNRVEPVLIADSSVLEDPRPGDPLEYPPFPGPDSLFPAAASVGTPRLDLDEGDQFAATRDQVEVVTAHPPPMRLDAPAAGLQPAAGGYFRLPAVALTRVGPSGGRDASGWHERKLAGAAAHGGAKSRTVGLKSAKSDRDCAYRAAGMRPLFTDHAGPSSISTAVDRGEILAAAMVPDTLCNCVTVPVDSDNVQ